MKKKKEKREMDPLDCFKKKFQDDKSTENLIVDMPMQRATAAGTRNEFLE